MSLQFCGNLWSFLWTCQQAIHNSANRQVINNMSKSIHHHTVPISRNWISAVFVGKATTIDTQADGAPKGTGPKLKRPYLTQSTHQTRHRPAGLRVPDAEITILENKLADFSSITQSERNHMQIKPLYGEIGHLLKAGGHFFFFFPMCNKHKIAS